MNESNVKALTELLMSFSPEPEPTENPWETGNSAAYRAHQRLEKLAKHLADHGVLACQSITDDEAINKIPMRLNRPSLILGENRANLMRDAFSDLARGELM